MFRTVDNLFASSGVIFAATASGVMFWAANSCACLRAKAAAPTVDLTLEVSLKQRRASTGTAVRLALVETRHCRCKDRTTQPEPSNRPSFKTAAALCTLIFKPN